jgi:hypothetical protein
VLRRHPSPRRSNDGSLNWECDTTKRHQSNALEILANHTARLPLPPYGLLKNTIHVPGPITRKYTVTSETRPRAIIASAANRLSCKDRTDELCLLAKMEFFHDERARKRLNITVWSRLHIIDPSIQPWKIDQKISDVNPQALHLITSYRANASRPSG